MADGNTIGTVEVVIGADNSDLLKKLDQIDKKMDEAHSVLCHFPIGYTYNENKTSFYRIALSEQFQILKEYPAGTSILDFIALETEEIIAYMKNMSENIITGTQ